MDYTTVIGLEVHVQLLTRTKLFSGSPTAFNPEQPNTQTDPVTLGLPGALPVMNQRAFDLALKTALAFHCEISRWTKWDRKQYFYPDLPRGYQISQYDMPFAHDGFFEVEVDPETESTRRVGIIRSHLEDDAGKNLHDESGRQRESRVDLNRAGTPLIEIVTEPDLRSSHDARRFLEELRLLLRYLDVSDCNMQEGSLRCDANVNLHIHTEDGHSVPTPIAEVKNLNSFRAVEMALDYEAQRQFEEWQASGHQMGDVPKQTRGWDADRGVTFAQRTKEEVADYRYFPDPDLVPVTVSDEQIAGIQSSLQEFPADRRCRFQIAYLLSTYDAGVVIEQGRPFADYFEAVAEACGDGKLAANWVTQNVLREMNDRQIDIEQFPIHPDVLAVLVTKIVEEEITKASAREIFAALMAEADEGRPLSTGRVEELIEEQGLALVSQSEALEAAIASVVAENPQAADDFRGGKQAAVGPLIGQVMRQVKGADPKTVRQMLIEKLSED